ncbi:hypothetical protein CBM2589_A90318 [Cupriavidus taiwanensis]|uniref:Uncharacterized protein n=1 Tax=Cupriavidus taiwanensis TaxID=164546 RepID=A0A375CF30_9BURK|nr:hypothetical protein CBM2589_A90318 [Cupriavidus taiwanensis]
MPVAGGQRAGGRSGGAGFFFWFIAEVGGKLGVRQGSAMTSHSHGPSLGLSNVGFAEEPDNLCQRIAAHSS